MGVTGKRADGPARVDDDPRSAARTAGLRYVTDARPGISRRRAGRGFVYTWPDGSKVDDPEHLARIRSLAVPPAWTEVWICPVSSGHLQATGRDARGRKQYRYHRRWREVRDETKYERMIAFGEALPRVRARVESDLARPGLPREKVLATVVRLLETTLIRVGNDEYARENRSFGLTTLKDRHVAVDGSEIRFRFTGKGGRQHDVDVRDGRLARIIKQCQDVPGQELFQYQDEDGEPRDVDSADVNDYIREAAGGEFTAKDFRTWAGTIAAATALQEVEPFGSEAEAKRNVIHAVERVAERLGNTPAVCRKCYVHPAILEAYMEGETLLALRRRIRKTASSAEGLRTAEAALLTFLRGRVGPEARPARRRA
jgi:DNA topoisomerase I